MTAIVQVQKDLLKAKNKFKNLGNKNNYKCESIISADDIAGAFESIEGVLIFYAIERGFNQDSRLRLGDFVESYLDRKSVVIDEISGVSCMVIKKIMGKTAPQGSP